MWTTFGSRWRTLCGAAVVILACAGCGGSGGGDDGGGEPNPSPPPETEAPPPPVAAPPTTPGVQATGAVLLQASNADDYGDAVMLELESGEQRLLPRSDIATAHTEKVDAWYASTFPESTADLARVEAAFVGRGFIRRLQIDRVSTGMGTSTSSSVIR